MIAADVRPAKRITFYADKNDSRRGVDLDSCLSRARDREMPGSAEQRLDLDDSAMDVNPIQESSRRRDCYGREYAQNAQCDDKLDQGESVLHLSFRAIAGLDSICPVDDPRRPETLG
jgi:hypothetical protein